MNIAVFCPNLIGDTVMATPVFRAVRAANPSARVVAVVRPGVSQVLDGNPWFDERILLDHRSKNQNYHTLSVVKQLRAEQIDLAILLPNSFRSALVAWLGGAKRRIGYARGGRSILLTDRLESLRGKQRRFVPTPIIDTYLGIPKALDFRIDSRQTELHTTSTNELALDLALKNLNISASDSFVCLNTGGAFGPAKAWPESHFGHVARRIASETSHKVIVICGPNEREAARQIVAFANHPNVLSMADQTLSLGLSKACVKRAALLLTTDSGPRHFAPAFDVPVLTVFGPTHIAWTKTPHPLSVDIFHPVDCGPCQQPTCSKGHHRCMTDLDPDAVFRAALQLLERSQHLIPSPHFFTNVTTRNT